MAIKGNINELQMMIRKMISPSEPKEELQEKNRRWERKDGRDIVLNSKDLGNLGDSWRC